MRWIGGRNQAAGLSARGFFDLFQKPALNTMATQIVAGQGGFLMSGFTLVNGEVKTATRFNPVFAALAQNTTDTLISGFSGSVSGAYHVPGRFIIFDNNGHVADSTDGVTWTLGALNEPAGNSIPQGYNVVYDDLNAKIIASPQGQLVSTANNVSPLNFTTVALPANVFFGSIAYKGTGTGITLGYDGPGGVNANNVYKSTNGGATWALVGATAFVNVGLIARGSTQWLAFGTSVTNIQVSVSTNDGTTWSAPANVPLNLNANTSALAIATDGAGNWVVIGNNNPPDNYIFSSNDGTTWISPNLSPGSNHGSQLGLLINSGGSWLSAWVDPTFTFAFLASSTDGQHWTKLNNVIDTP